MVINKYFVQSKEFLVVIHSYYPHRVCLWKSVVRRNMQEFWKTSERLFVPDKIRVWRKV
jgi:hypothetical protein